MTENTKRLLAADALKDVEHAFWSVVDVLADNLPDTYGDDDPEIVDYCRDCVEKFENAQEEFENAVSKLKQLAG